MSRGPRRRPRWQPLDSLIERLKAYPAVSPQVWRSRCPAHRDRGQRLLIVLVSGEPPVLVCRHGCTQARILEAVGLPTDAFRRRTAVVRPAPGVDPADPESVDRIRVGSLERGVLAALASARNGQPRDRLPSLLWNWPEHVVWVRTKGYVWSYPTIDRGTYEARQASLSRTLASLRRKGLIVPAATGGWTITPRGRQQSALGGPRTMTSSPSVAAHDALSGEVIPRQPPTTRDPPAAVPEPHEVPTRSGRVLDFSRARGTPKVPYQSNRRLELE